MNNPLLLVYQAILKLRLSGLTILVLGLTSFAADSFAQVSGEITNPEERELYETIPGQSKQKSILDATNPLELMNRLRSISALDNATSPSDAIDDALRAFEEAGQLSPIQD